MFCDKRNQGEIRFSYQLKLYRGESKMVIGRGGLVREDLKKQYSKYYSLKDKEVALYVLPEMTYLTASGLGARNIYQMYDYKEIWTMGRFINRVKHYTIHQLERNFSRMPLEMEWKDIAQEDSLVPYRARMAVPEYINLDLYNLTMEDLKKRLGEIDFKLEIANVSERNCAQLLHEGSYESIHLTRERLVNDLQQQGYSLKGDMQEIYMNHPHCNPPEKLKILLRQEVE